MGNEVTLPGNSDASRRDFIKGASFGGLMLMMGGVPLRAEDAPGGKAAPEETHYSTQAAPVSCALIGCGVWGREILQTLAVLPNAPVVAICDTYKPFLNRAKEFAPKAEAVEDYKKVLEMPSVEAVFIATPTHMHKDIVIDALKAGKSVYCEAPLANNIEDARAIAKAAHDAVKVNFQAGLQYRSDPLKHHVISFMRNGAVGKQFFMRGQWHQKNSWRRTSPNPEREKALNWRLDSALSLGLAGEVGIHQIDLASWYFGKRPHTIQGWGAIQLWKDDGRAVADTIQTLIEYPEQANYFYDATLASSFQDTYDTILGTTAGILLRENIATHGSEAWWFKEADANTFGWEIYAKSQQFGRETGISLSADASKSVHAAKDPKASMYEETPLHYALKSFLKNSHNIAQEVQNFVTSYGADTTEGLKEILDKVPRDHAAGYLEGFEATVTAIKVNEAITSGSKLVIKPEFYDLG